MHDTKARLRVLFVSHSASRNGASLLLLAFMQWLRQRVDWEIDLVVHGGGPLLPHFAAVADRMTVWRDPTTRLDALLGSRRGHWRTALERQYRRAVLPSRRYDLVYGNTAAVAPLLDGLTWRKTPLLWHIHEMGYALHQTLKRRSACALHAADCIVAVSQATRRALVQNFGIADARIAVVNGFVPDRDVHLGEPGMQRNETRAALGWPLDAFVIGGCGSPGWRKGTDLFVQIARRFVARRGQRGVRFVWVGGHPDERDAVQFCHDVEALGLSSCCQLMYGTDDVTPLYQAMDVFALTSREDPFPLVMLEAGALGLPVVGFENSGGAAECLTPGTGTCVPYLDIDAFVDELIRLQADPAARASIGQAARRRILDFFTVDVQGPQLAALMEACMAGSRPAAQHEECRSHRLPQAAQRAVGGTR